MTHHHWDHVFGISEVGLPTIAHQKTRNELKNMKQISWYDSDLERGLKERTISQFAVDAIRKEFGNERDIELCLPEITFETRLELDLGGITCLIEHVGGDHADDSCVIYIPEEKTLFLGDCICALIAPDALSYTVEKSLNLVDRLEKFDAEFIFYSHHDVPLSKQEFNYELDVVKNVALLTKEFKSDESSIIKELSNRFERELSDDEVETISFFINGLGHGEDLY
ncbi:MBL fold metallo-hydrolase [Alicyclobacillus tolerans]|uniref:MBL fold metallo-hydrolase n=1 Tax=Alicyclobacillus tolerans TaxID=90970 RepID=UPI003B75E9D0